jgi:hypothetical protein
VILPDEVKGLHNGPMEHKTWTTIDKASWGPGPWQDEPDKEQWADEATGYACLIKRNRFGALCGYVGVPEGHPWHGRDFSELDETVDVHGGLTYADSCQEGPEDKTICHVPGPGEPEPLWWFGFDCHHAWDIGPAMKARDRERGDDLDFPGSTYKTVAYVKAECASLAKQAAEADRVSSAGKADTA